MVHHSRYFDFENEKKNKFPFSSFAMKITRWAAMRLCGTVRPRGTFFRAPFDLYVTAVRYATDAAPAVSGDDAPCDSSTQTTTQGTEVAAEALDSMKAEGPSAVPFTSLVRRRCLPLSRCTVAPRKKQGARARRHSCHAGRSQDTEGAGAGVLRLYPVPPAHVRHPQRARLSCTVFHQVCYKLRSHGCCPFVVRRRWA